MSDGLAARADLTSVYVPVAEVVRSGFVEGVHFGAVVALAADGSLAFSHGDVSRPMHPRSANKLLQATGMRELGLHLADELLALSAASHWGESFHLTGVRSILAKAGLNESALQTTSALPEDPQAKREAIEAGIGPSAIRHGCSGKHAAMLATCVLGGWPTDSYLSPEHPLQQALRDSVERTIGTHVAHEAIDGCGAPAWAMSLRSLAAAYRDAVLAPAGSAAEVAAAMRAHPQYVGGTQSEVTALMRAVPGLLVKDGAESVYVAAFADGRAVAVKISDGGFRAGQVVLVDALLRLGAADEPTADREALARWGVVPVLGHGERVGEVRPLRPR